LSRFRANRTKSSGFPFIRIASGFRLDSIYPNRIWITRRERTPKSEIIVGERIVHLRAILKGSGRKSPSSPTFLFSLLLSTSLAKGRRDGERAKVLPVFSFFPFYRSWSRAERTRARKRKRDLRTKAQKKQESLDPIFRAVPAILVPSDHRCGST